MKKPWDEMREFIQELYIDQNMTLAAVMVVMKEKHGFEASVRAYRHHLDKWQCYKYNRSSSTSTSNPGANPGANPGSSAESSTGSVSGSVSGSRSGSSTISSDELRFRQPDPPRHHARRPQSITAPSYRHCCCAGTVSHLTSPATWHGSNRPGSGMYNDGSMASVPRNHGHYPHYSDNYNDLHGMYQQYNDNYSESLYGIDDDSTSCSDWTLSSSPAAYGSSSSTMSAMSSTPRSAPLFTESDLESFMPIECSTGPEYGYAFY